MTNNILGKGAITRIVPFRRVGKDREAAMFRFLESPFAVGFPRVPTVSAVTLSLAFLGPIHAADPTPGIPLPKKSPIVAVDSDVMLALAVKAALASSKETASLTLTVSVVDRRAVIGGPLPDADLIPRIETIARKVRGIEDAEVACWVPATNDPLRALVADKLGKKELSPVPVEGRSPETQPVIPPAPVHVGTGNVVVRRMTVPSGPAAFLLDPIAPPRAGTVASDPVHIPPAALPTGRLANEEPGRRAVEAIRSADSRFEDLRIEWKAGTVTITGTARDHEDVWDLASKIRKCPGVERVVIGSISVK